MIHGLDTGSRKWHVVRENGDHAHHSVAQRVATDAARIELAVTWREYRDLNIAPGDIVICERPLALQNPNTTIILSMAASALYLATYWPEPAPTPAEVDWRWADVALWKRHICGAGNIDKDGIVAWVRANLGLEFDEPDHYDAACLVEFGKLWEMLGKMPEPLKKKGRKR